MIKGKRNRNKNKENLSFQRALTNPTAKQTDGISQKCNWKTIAPKAATITNKDKKQTKQFIFIINSQMPS
ncbi:MAG: hypothetical protein GY757_34980 [bacterium]|nr:hypothetical protein [bacterium]